MTPDELRALADALPEGVHWSDPITPDMLAEAIRRFCADAQPVPAGWKLVPVEPTPEMLSAVGMMDGYDWHAPGCSPDADHANWYSAMIAAAPAVPQADALPVSLVRAYNAGYMAGHHDTVEGGFVDIHPSDMDTYHADVVAELGLPAAPQAEPIDPHMIVADDRFPDAQAVPQEENNVWKQIIPDHEPQAEPKRDQSMLDLLAVIHCDGGHHTEAVGIEQSIKDAQAAVCALKVRLALAEPKREQIDNAMAAIAHLLIVHEGRKAGEARRIAAQMIEHGIGGSDE